MFACGFFVNCVLCTLFFLRCDIYNVLTHCGTMFVKQIFKTPGLDNVKVFSASWLWVLLALCVSALLCCVITNILTTYALFSENCSYIYLNWYNLKSVIKLILHKFILWANFTKRNQVKNLIKPSNNHLFMSCTTLPMLLGLTIHLTWYLHKLNLLSSGLMSNIKSNWFKSNWFEPVKLIWCLTSNLSTSLHTDFLVHCCLVTCACCLTDFVWI